MNKKGFTMVELLAAIVILSILSGFGMMTFFSYRDRAAKKTYRLLHEGVAQAAENYFMDTIGAQSVTVAELVEGNYLDTPKDPYNKDGICTGTVERINLKKQAGDAIEEYSYRVKLKCSKGCECKIYPTKTSCGTC